MLHYYFCLNQISYLVACEHAIRAIGKEIIIFIDLKRVRPQQRYKALDVRPFSRVAMFWCLLKSLRLRPSVVYIPHHRTGRLAQWLAAMARESHFVDDGMDTLRMNPRNIDLRRIPRRAKLLTFSNYKQFGVWTDLLRRVPVCSLETLLDDDRPALVVEGFKTVIIESPGVISRADEVHASGDLLYISHPSSVKRNVAPSRATVVRSDAYSIEKSLADFKGTVVVGETLLLPFLLYCTRLSDIAVQVELTDVQHRNLQALHRQLEQANVALRLH
jgi:hypothetical protein